jgi:hypothetical protein
MQTGMLIFFGCIAVVVAGCHSDTQKDQASTEIVKYDEYEPVTWTPDGEHLLIKQGGNLSWQAGGERDPILYTIANTVTSNALMPDGARRHKPASNRGSLRCYNFCH